VDVPLPSVLDLFLDLCALPSPSGDERAVAERVQAYLDALGLEWEEDDAAAALGGTTGNTLCRLPGRRPGGVPLLLCAHLDTVPPDGAIEPVVEEGIVRNAAGTILGGDNKSAVVAMLEAARIVVSEDRPHGGIELLFTPKEEVGLLGAYAFDVSRLEAQVGYVYDQAAPIGEIILGAPSARAIEARFHGRAAHAGMAPEEGRSAIAAAARAVADLRLGRVDEHSTANVGRIAGGTARNIVPEWCVVTAEARSQDDARLADLVQEMLDAFGFAATLGDCTLETEVRAQYRGYRFRPDDPAIRLAAGALARAGFEPTTALSGGGADANVFNERGLPCVNLANGMAEIHTPEEHIAVADLEAMVDVTLALVDGALAA
jgi:tripeptide aminopeptidase